MTDECPICKTKALALGRTGDAMGFDCPEHDKFKVSDTVLSLLRAKTREQWEAALAKAKQLHAEEMQKLAGGMDLPGLGDMLNQLSDTRG